MPFSARWVSLAQRDRRPHGDDAPSNEIHSGHHPPAVASGHDPPGALSAFGLDSENTGRIGGRLRDRIATWRRHTRDPEVIKLIEEGLRIRTSRSPTCSNRGLFGRVGQDRGGVAAAR